ncbi:hypothetical protein J6590_085555 [Homalodisca vitripennis]|nr:hypothetical protein J6590_085555 [Homalodisca vitripennis]
MVLLIKTKTIFTDSGRDFTYNKHKNCLNIPVNTLLFCRRTSDIHCTRIGPKPTSLRCWNTGWMSRHLSSLL